jgi:mono/diheme cytochrome c family protein
MRIYRFCKCEEYSYLDSILNNLNDPMNSEDIGTCSVDSPSPGPVGEISRRRYRPIFGWLMAVVGFGIFGAGSFFSSYGNEVAAGLSDDERLLGKKLFSANCAACHQANGQGQPGQFPPLARSGFVLGDAGNRLIVIILKGLQGPIKVKGQAFNSAMQAWEGQYTDQQVAAILSYVRSDWGNSAPMISTEAVKAVRDGLKSRKEQWTWLN